MNAPSSVVSRLALVVHLMRASPDDTEAQRQAFLGLTEALAGRRLVVGADVGGITVDDRSLPQGAPFVGELHGQFLAHGIGRITIPEALPAAPLMILLRTLARPRGEIATVREFVGLLDPEGARLIEVRGPRELPPADQLVMLDEPTAGADSYNAVPAEPESRGDAEPVWREATTGSGRDSLREAQVAADGAMNGQDWPGLLDVMIGIITEEAAQADPIQRRRYHRVVQGMLPRRAIEALARMSGEGNRSRVSRVLRRIGSEATVVLLDLMTQSESLAERREYFTLLSRMEHGEAAILNRLTDDKWFVVRNVAELCGVLAIEDAVPRLAAQLAHADPRVRRAVAVALARIGTHEAAEPLRQALHDSEPTVRLPALQALDGTRSRGLAMSLAVMLDEERHPDVRRELHLALGRIGTPEAVQALARSAQPGRALFGRKPAAIRLAAVEGLALAGNAQAMGALRDLARDRDRKVRQAARQALATLETMG